MKCHQPILSVLFAFIVLSSGAQTEREILQDQVHKSILDYEKDADNVQIDSNTLVWQQIDTFKLVLYNSAIRGAHHLDTLEITLRFEAGWSEELIEETKRQNTERIDKLKKVYIAYMDSIDWKGYKIDKQGFESSPVKYLKWKYPVKFTQEECDEIDLIRRCPNYLIGNIGVFSDCSHAGIDPVDVENKFLDKMRFIQQDIFNSDHWYFGQTIYW